MNSIKILSGVFVFAVVAGIGYTVGREQVRSDTELLQVIDLGNSLQAENVLEALRTDDAANPYAESGLQAGDSTQVEKILKTVQLLEEKIGSMSRKIAALEAQASQNSQFSDSGPDLRSSKDDGLATEQTEQEHILADQHITNAMFDHTYREMFQEEYDADWASEVNESVSNVITRNALKGIQIDDTRCGATLCALTLSNRSGDTDASSKLLEDLVWSGYRLKMRDRYPIDGTRNIEILLGKDSREFGFASEG